LQKYQTKNFNYISLFKPVLSSKSRCKVEAMLKAAITHNEINESIANALVLFHCMDAKVTPHWNASVTLLQ